LNEAATDPPAPAALSNRALLALLACVTALGPISTNLYIPVLPEIRDYFQASVAQVQATFSISLVTFALGMLFWGPVSDRYGRRSAVLAGLVVFVMGALTSLCAPSLGWLVVGRGVQAFGTATGIVVSRAIVSDRYPFERMARALAQLTMAVIMGNALAPVVGGYLASLMGWRAIFGVLLGTVGFVAYLVWKRMPETRSSQAPPPRPREMLAAATTLLRMPLFAACVVQSGVVYATFLVFISLTPYVMVSALGRSPTEFGMYYVLIALGYFFGSWSVGRWMTSREQHWMIRRGIVLQLAGAATALILFAVGLGHPLTLFVPLAVLTYGQGLSLPNVTATSVSLVPEQAGVASSVLGFLQQVIGAVSVQWMGIFPTDTALPMLIFCTVVCAAGMVALRLLPRFEDTRRRGRAPPSSAVEPR